jgi:hypothetical protein
MITKEINEQAQLWFHSIIIRTYKIDGVTNGNVSVNGDFKLPNGTVIESVNLCESIENFLGSVATKLSLDPAVLYQAICDSLEESYTATLPVVP